LFRHPHLSFLATARCTGGAWEFAKAQFVRHGYIVFLSLPILQLPSGPELWSILVAVGMSASGRQSFVVWVPACLKFCWPTVKAQKCVPWLTLPKKGGPSFAFVVMWTGALLQHEPTSRHNLVFILKACRSGIRFGNHQSQKKSKKI